MIENKEIFVINEGTEIYSIYSLVNKNIEKNLIYIDMEDRANILRKVNNFLKDDLIIFKIEYNYLFIKL